jgi:hypothetical protein
VKGKNFSLAALRLSLTGEIEKKNGTASSLARIKTRYIEI